MQTLLNNPMASPATGLAAASGFGAALTLYFDGFGLPTLDCRAPGRLCVLHAKAGLLFVLASMRASAPMCWCWRAFRCCFCFRALLSLLAVHRIARTQSADHLLAVWQPAQEPLVQRGLRGRGADRVHCAADA